MSPSVLTSQGQGQVHGSRPHCCLFDPTSPSPLTQPSLSSIFSITANGCTWSPKPGTQYHLRHLPPPHTQSCPVCLFISRILVRPPLLWSPRLQLLPPLLGSLPRPTAWRRRLFSNSLPSHYAVITYGFPNQLVSTQRARMGSCLSPNLQFVGRGGRRWQRSVCCVVK